jgi:hypothetical protein
MDEMRAGAEQFRDALMKQHQSDLTIQECIN